VTKKFIVCAAPPAGAGDPAAALVAGALVAGAVVAGVPAAGVLAVGVLAGASGAARLDEAQALARVGSTSASTTGSRVCIAVLH
jgi:hypothetical protein